MSDGNEYFEEIFLNAERENELHVFGVPPPPTRIDAARTFIRSMLGDSAVYRSCDLSDGERPKLVVAHVGKMDGNKPVIVVTPFLIPAGSELQRTIRSEIGSIRAFFHEHAHLPILFRVNAIQREIVAAMRIVGAKLSALELVGDVDTAVQNLQRKSGPRSVVHAVEALDIAKDLPEVLKLVTVSSQSDPSCRTRDLSEEQNGEIEPFIRQSCDEQLAFVVRSAGSIVGTIILFKQGASQENVCVGFVGVHPKFQGQGISNFLYLHALQVAKQLGYRRFFGFSTTERVLSQNEKLARKVRSYHFILMGNENG
jgi:GNAT superfamily N-acetyltransferase